MSVRVMPTRKPQISGNEVRAEPIADATQHTDEANLRKVDKNSINRYINARKFDNLFQTTLAL